MVLNSIVSMLYLKSLELTKEPQSLHTIVLNLACLQCWEGQVCSLWLKIPLYFQRTLGPAVKAPWPCLLWRKLGSLGILGLFCLLSPIQPRKPSCPVLIYTHIFAGQKILPESVTAVCSPQYKQYVGYCGSPFPCGSLATHPWGRKEQKLKAGFRQPWVLQKELLGVCFRETAHFIFLGVRYIKVPRVTSRNDWLVTTQH